MKKFSISHWGVSFLHPDQTVVTANVLEEAAPGITKKVTFEFMVAGRFERMSYAFHEAVGNTLVAAQLISQEELDVHLSTLQAELAAIQAATPSTSPA